MFPEVHGHPCLPHESNPMQHAETDPDIPLLRAFICIDTTETFLTNWSKEILQKMYLINKKTVSYLFHQLWQRWHPAAVILSLFTEKSRQNKIRSPNQTTLSLQSRYRQAHRLCHILLYRMCLSSMSGCTCSQIHDLLCLLSKTMLNCESRQWTMMSIKLGFSKQVISLWAINKIKQTTHVIQKWQICIFKEPHLICHAFIKLPSIHLMLSHRCLIKNL